MNKTGMLHASSAWVTSVTLPAPSKFTPPGYLQPLVIDSQQVYQHHFQAHLRQSLRPAVCAQYQKAEQEQRRPDYTTELAHAQREWIKNRQQVSYLKYISSMLSKSTPRKPLVRQLLLFFRWYWCYPCRQEGSQCASFQIYQVVTLPTTQRPI